ncbi:MAG: hypothetical protein MGU50_15830 [Trichodesmium sp. MAG_R02]|nr:hypothetical protein [Trichodesmium sp. MAG_R02]
MAQNTHATNFLCSIELICLICWLKIVMIIHVSFCTTCRNCRMWDISKERSLVRLLHRIVRLNNKKVTLKVTLRELPNGTGVQVVILRILTQLDTLEY